MEGENKMNGAKKFAYGVVCEIVPLKLNVRIASAKTGSVYYLR